MKDFEITNNITDFIKSKDIQEWIEGKGLGISMAKFGMEMKKYVVIHNHDKVKTDKKKLVEKLKIVGLELKKRMMKNKSKQTKILTNLYYFFIII